MANHPPDPSRRHPQKKNGPSTQGGVSCLTNPRPGLSGKMKGFRRHPRPKGFKGALTGGQSLPAVGVTVLPKRVLAKHRTNQTTNCHSPAKKRKSRSSDHQQHKQKMKETKRKQKHPNWVMRVHQGRRDATATQQTTRRCPKRQKNTKMRKAEKNTKGGKRRQTCIYIHTYKHTAHSKTHKLSTQHILNFDIHSFASWIPGCSSCKSRSRNARTTERRQDKKQNDANTAGMQHTTHL